VRQKYDVIVISLRDVAAAESGLLWKETFVCFEHGGM
jgi:hypothetical protein